MRARATGFARGLALNDTAAGSRGCSDARDAATARSRRPIELGAEVPCVRRGPSLLWAHTQYSTSDFAAEDRPCDDPLLHLIGALVDLADFGIPVDGLQRPGFLITADEPGEPVATTGL